MSSFDNYKLTKDYDEYTKLQMFLNYRLQEKAQQPLDLDKAISSASLQRDPNSQHPMNLDRLRSDITQTHSKFQQAASKVSEREETLKAELNRIAAAKSNNDSSLLQIMSDLEQKRLSEVKALKEKELVSRALKDLDKKNLNALEFQKKMQMRSLKEERESLNKKEEELFKELERMQSRLLVDEENIKKAKNEIAAGIVTAKDLDQDEVQKKIEIYSNMRGKEVLAMREKKEELEIEKARLENELRAVERGEIRKSFKSFDGDSKTDTGRKNNSSILAAKNMLDSAKKEEEIKKGMLKPLHLEEMRNLPIDIVKANEKWKEDLERLDIMEKAHNEYVKNEPLYDVKPSESAKPMFIDRMKEMVKQKDNLKAEDRARTLEYIKQDIDIKDLNKSPIQPLEVKPASPAAKYNIAQYKLSSEPYSYQPDKLPENIFSKQTFEKYQQEALNKQRDPERNMKSQVTHGSNNYTQSFPGYPQYSPNPFMPLPYPPAPNTENEELKKELKSLKKQLKAKPAVPFPNDFNFAPLPPGDLPEEKLLNNILNQEQAELKVLSALQNDPDLYNAKMQHFKEMSAIRARMEATLQELTIQRMRQNMKKEEILDNKQLAEELYREELKKQQFLAKIRPEEKKTKDYDPNKGLSIGWEMVTGVPLRFKRVQLAYGVYERGEVRLAPKLVLPVGTENDPFNSLALRGRCHKDVHDIKKLPPQNSIISVIEVQGLESNDKSSAVGWSAFELFTPQKTVLEGYWKVPVYAPPTDIYVYINDIRLRPIQPNSFIYFRIYSAENFSKYPPSQDFGKFLIPPVHGLMSNRHSPNIVQPDLLSRHSNEPSRVLSIPQSNAPSRIEHRSYQSNIPSRVEQRSQVAQRKPQSGLLIRLESLNQFKSRSFLKFKLKIIRNNFDVVDDRGGYCLWTSESVNTQNTDINSLDQSRVSSRSQLYEEIAINKQTFFLKDFNKYQSDINWEDDLVLIIEILEKNPAKINSALERLGSPNDNYFPIAWTLFVLSDEEQQKLNFSTVDLDLFKHPIPNDLTMIESCSRVEGSIKLTVQDLSGEPVSFSKQKPENSEIFLENLSPQYDDSKDFKKGDGVDVYIDAARVLPDNTTCCKIIVKAVNSKGQTIGDAVAGLSELESEAFNPVFGFRTEFRTPVFDPTATLVIVLVTVDAAHGEVGIIGYSAINLFLHKYRKNQPNSPNESEFILNSGAFQLPIYCQEPYRKDPFNLECFTILEIVPCATLLIRILDAPKAQQGVRVLSIKDVPKNEWYIRGVIVPPPKYESRAYNTSFCMPNQAEREVYIERAKRRSPTVAAACLDIIKNLSEKYPENEEEMNDWMDNKLNINPNTPIIDMKYFATYSKKLGFKIAIDAFHHVNGLMPLIALVSLNPPASLYTQSVIRQDVHIFDRYNLDSVMDTPEFIDGFQAFKNVQFNEFLHIIVDVRKVDMQEKNLKPVAWTVIPVFYSDGYVKSGIYQIPLFAGPVPFGLLTEMTNQDPWSFLMSASKKKGGPKLFQNSSVLLRLIDSQREGHFNQPLDLRRLDYSYLPKESIANIVYNSASYQRNNTSGQNVKSLVKGGLSPVNYWKEIHDIVVSALDLNHL